MKIVIPDFCLVVFFGTADPALTVVGGNFQPEELISVAGEAPFATLAQSMAAVGERLQNRKLTAVDATHLPGQDRSKLVSIARKHYALPVAVVFEPRHVDMRLGGIDRRWRNPPPSDAKLSAEGFRSIQRMAILDGDATLEVARVPLPVDLRREEGLFDIIGDVHGCATELEALMAKLGYHIEGTGPPGVRHYRLLKRSGRKAIFAGDLVDRGPRVADALSLAMAMAEAGEALCVIGNHDDKFLRWLKGHDVTIDHGLEKSVEQMAKMPPDVKTRVRAFLESLTSHLWLDGGKLAVAHAGIKEGMIGRSTRAVHEFCLYGETTGAKDEHGLPIRGNWAAGYSGPTSVVYGHTPVRQAAWFNNTICIDTGCVFGGALTALRWPEKELVKVAAESAYSQARGTFASASSSF